MNHIKKTIIISNLKNKPLGKHGEGLFKTFIEVLGITQYQAEIILSKNCGMRQTLDLEMVIGKVSDLSVLLNIAFLRQKDDFSSLTLEDIEYAKEKYKINLKALYPDVKNHDYLDIYEMLEMNTHGNNDTSKILRKGKERNKCNEK